MFGRYYPLELSVQANCTEGIGWIFHVFGECVDNPAKLAGFIVGFVSLLLWLIPLIPQLIDNYKLKQCDGLSLTFLLFWMFGDSANMLGAILTHQLAIQQIIGVYYIFQDFCILGQFFYYKKIYPRRHPEATLPASSAAILPCLMLVTLAGSKYCLRSSLFDSNPYGIGASRPQSRKLLHQFFPNTEHAIGYMVGSVSAFFYFIGRVPQLYKNYKRKSLEGVSIAMFVIIVFANLTYGLSVFLGGTGWLYIWHHAPWLAGSLGCCFLDILIIGQYFYYYQGGAYENEDDDAPLIRPGADLMI